MNLHDIVNHFSSARTEFSSRNKSVLGAFVVPPFLNQNDLATAKHSLAIEGGRGCGKTMYIRYFSHWTQFDPQNSEVTEDSIKSIVLYWKPDTIFCRSMSQPWLTEQNSRVFFNSLVGYEILLELLCALTNIENHFPCIGEELKEAQGFWSAISSISGKNLTEISECKEWASDQRYLVEISINQNDVKGFRYIEPKAMLNRLLPELLGGVKTLSRSRFKLFIDEFENLALYQQKIINGYRKHSDALFSWNVAHKRDALVTRMTDGDEQLQDPDDYRQVCIDNLIDDRGYRVFASEIFLLYLQMSGLASEDSNILDRYDVGRRENVSYRKEQLYQDKVLTIVKNILPTPTLNQLAEEAVSLKGVRNRIVEKLLSLDILDRVAVENLVNKSPDIAVTTWLVCAQRNFSSKELKQFIKDGCPSKHSFKQKIDTYLFSALLSLNKTFSYSSIPVYAGFDRFCLLSSKNIRHFTELCYQSLKNIRDQQSDISAIEELPPLTYASMHEGAISTSGNAVKDISTFSPKGQSLSALAYRLGDLYELALTHKGHTEPEVNHFFIKSDYGTLAENIELIINQAKCWRVLIEFDSTKDRNPDKSAAFEYMLNPIYAPFFGISYRKARNIGLTQEDLTTICLGDNDEYNSLRKRFIDRWGGKKNGQSDLFQD